MTYTGIVVVIPTRNRSAIAVNAVRSVLDQPVENLHVLVSDNSTTEAEREALAAFCSSQNEDRLRYVRPAEPMPMAEHWEWALDEALRFFSTSHVTYLTDRMMFRRDALKDAVTAATLHAGKVITYNMDRILDHVRPIRVEQYQGSGRLLEVETVALSRDLSRAIFRASLPRMLNSIVPVELFARIRERFGNVFLSIAPDFRFCCRCLELEDTLIFYDKSLLFHYALDRSNGATVSRGEVSTDNVDFAANLPVDNSRRNYATPIPGMITATNAVFNEYLLFKQETNSPRFFDIDLRKYLAANAEEVREFGDEKLRDEMLALLAANGYESSAGGSNSNSVKPAFQKRLRAKLKRLATSPSSTNTWLFAARNFNITPPGENLFEFATLDSAIDYARNISHGNIRAQSNLKESFVSVVPMSFRRALHERRNQAKLATLQNTKSRFRANGAKSQAPEGVNLIGYIRADMGLGVAARGLAAAFDAAGIPFNVINMQHGNTSSHTDLSWTHKEARDSHYDVTVVCVNPDNSFYLRTQISPETLGDRYVIANWYWELPEMPDEWLAEFEYTDEVWAATNFIRDAMSSKAPVPVVRVPPVVQLSHGQTFSRVQLGLPEAQFLFLAMFDTKSVLERKNPLGVLRAFKSAFARDDASVGLVLKFSNPDYEQPVLRELREELVGCKNVFLIDRLLTRDELTSLIAVCDCFVSLHRSEGFGLGPAEAMSLGKPAIITNWSGNTDYMTDDNCIPIDYELVQLGRDYGPYRAHQRWAEPDLKQAAQWMKRIFSEPALARQIGLRGRQTIRAEFSPEAVGKIVQGRLQEIRGRAT
jgi:glycosyltransferase involved in cell wall biosynthesis